MPSILKDAQIAAISLVDKGANLKKIFLFKRADDAGVPEEGEVAISLVKPIIKGFGMDGARPDAWDVFYCVVAVPDEVDQQGDIWDADEIRKAAHDYVEGGGLINLMHKTMEPVGKLVESAVALSDMSVNGEVIRKGSWYIAVRPNEDMKGLIEKGELTGVSVQGSAKREPVFTPGIDSPGTMLHTVSKASVRTLDGKAIKEGAAVHLVADPAQSFIVLGEHPETGKLVVGNASGQTLEVDALDLLTPQTAQAKMEQAQAAAAPAPMQLQYAPDGQSPFASVYQQAEAAQGEAQQQEQFVGKSVAGQVALDGQQGVWRTIRGARTFVSTDGEKTGTILAGPEEVRGISLEGLTKRTELLPELFEQPLVKDSRGRQLHRGDYVSHVMDPSRAMPVVEVLPQGVVVEVEKEGATMPTQSMVSPRQVVYSTGPQGGKGGMEDLTNALIDDFDENEQLRDALGRYGIHTKDQIKEAVETGQLSEVVIRELVKLVDGPADSGDDRNVEAGVAVGQGRANHVYKSSDGSMLDIDAMVQALNAVPGSTPEVGAMSEETSVEKAVPKHPRDKCVAGGCPNCEGEEVAKADESEESEATPAFPGAAPPFKKKPKKDDAAEDESEEPVEKAGDQPAFPGAAAPFPKKRRIGNEGAEYQPPGQERVEEAEAEGGEKAAEAAAAQARNFLPRNKKNRLGGENTNRIPEGENPVSKHFEMGQPHEHPHGEDGPKKRPRLGPDGQPMAEEPAEKAGFPAGRLPSQPMGGRKAPHPGVMGKPALPNAVPVDAGAPRPDQPTPPAPKGEDEAPLMSPEQKAKAIQELQAIAAAGDQALLAALQEMGVTDPAQLPEVLAQLDDQQLMMLVAKFMQNGRQSQTPAANGHGLGVGADKADKLIGNMTKAALDKHGIVPGPQEPKRLPAGGANVVKGQGARLQLDGAVVKQGGEVTTGKMFVGPDGKRYIAREVTDATVTGFAGGREVKFPRGQVQVTKQGLSKRGERVGERLPFPDGLLAKSGKEASLTPNSIVRVKGGGLGEVLSIADDGTVTVIVDEDGLPKRHEYKKSQVTLMKAAIKVGDAVVLPDDTAGEVDAIDGTKVTVLTVGKGLKERKRTYAIADLKRVGGKEAVEKTAPLPGSMHGKDPKKHGKIRHIVRSFGKWAGGKHSVCVTRLRTEHPEVAKGREAQLCAWLKDQWAGTTHWRNGGDKDGVKKDAGTELLDPNFVPTDVEVDDLFATFCDIFGHDQEHLLAQFEQLDEEGVDAFLDELLGPDLDPAEENVPETLAPSPSASGTLASDDSPESSRGDEADEGLGRVRGMFKRALGIQLDKEAPASREGIFLTAVESLAEQLVVTAGEDDANLRKRQSEAVLDDFGRFWDEFSSQPRT